MIDAVDAIVVRATRRTDARALIELFDEHEFGAEADRYDHGDAFKHPRLRSWVAVDGERVVGAVEADFGYDYGEQVAALGVTPPHVWIYAVCVRAPYRRCGAGRLLLRQVAVDAARAGLSYLALAPIETAAGDDGHLPFFRSCGLQPISPGRYLSAYGAWLTDIVGIT